MAKSNVPHRRYEDDFKRRVVAEANAADVSVSEIGRRHGLNANLVFNWRKKFGGKASGAALAEPQLLALRSRLREQLHQLQRRPPLCWRLFSQGRRGSAGGCFHLCARAKWAICLEYPHRLQRYSSGYWLPDQYTPGDHSRPQTEPYRATVTLEHQIVTGKQEIHMKKSRYLLEDYLGMLIKLI